MASGFIPNELISLMVYINMYYIQVPITLKILLIVHVYIHTCTYIYYIHVPCILYAKIEPQSKTIIVIFYYLVSHHLHIGVHSLGGKSVSSEYQVLILCNGVIVRCVLQLYDYTHLCDESQPL